MRTQTPNLKVRIGNFSRELGRYYWSVSTFHPDMSLPQFAFQVPHGVQHAMLAESMPVLSGAVALFEVFMSQWEALGKKHNILTPLTRLGLHWAKKYYQSMDHTDAYIVTMGEFLYLISPCIDGKSSPV